MSDFSKLEIKLQKKIEQGNKLEEEIKQLREKLQEEKEATIIKEIRKLKITNEEYFNLSKGLKDKTLLEFLEKKYQLQKNKGEGEKEDETESE